MTNFTVGQVVKAATNAERKKLDEKIKGIRASLVRVRNLHVSLSALNAHSGVSAQAGGQDIFDQVAALLNQYTEDTNAHLRESVPGLFVTKAPKDTLIITLSGDERSGDSQGGALIPLEESVDDDEDKPEYADLKEYPHAVTPDQLQAHAEAMAKQEAELKDDEPWPTALELLKGNTKGITTAEAHDGQPPLPLELPKAESPKKELATAGSSKGKASKK